MQERDGAFDFPTSIEDHEFIVELIRAGNEMALDREIERHVLRSSTRVTRGAAHGTIDRTAPAQAGTGAKRG